MQLDKWFMHWGTKNEVSFDDDVAEVLSIDVHLLNFILMTEKLKLSLLLSGNYLSENYRVSVVIWFFIVVDLSLKIPIDCY